MRKPQTEYIAALQYSWLNKLYDPLMRLTMRETAFRQQLLAQAQVHDHTAVLDVGCGTGTFALLIKSRSPRATVVGLDGDANILQIATAKGRGAGLRMGLIQGLAYQMPFPDDCFERVVSSLVFHHLTRAQKVSTFQEIYRVLRPGGELHFVDWGRPTNVFLRAAFLVVQALDGFETTLDSVHGTVPTLLENTGFDEVVERGHLSTVFGTLRFHAARKAG